MAHTILPQCGVFVMPYRHSRNGYDNLCKWAVTQIVTRKVLETKGLMEIDIEIDIVDYK